MNEKAQNRYVWHEQHSDFLLLIICKVASLSKMYLTAKEIIIESLKSIGQFLTCHN